MSAHNILNDMNSAEVREVDPGNAGVLTVTKWFQQYNLISAGAETRTLPAPVKTGQMVCLAHKTDGGDITVTVTGGYDELGTTAFVLSDPGQFGLFMSIDDAGSYKWRVIANHLVGNMTGLTATPAEINQAVGDGDEVVITTNVIDASENGKTFYLSLAAGFTSTLPAPALGLRFRFIVKTAPTGAAYIIVTTSGANLMYGMMEERAGTAGVAGAARDTFNFVANQSIIGDWVEFYSDGTNWYYHGMVDVAAGNTVAQT